MQPKIVSAVRRLSFALSEDYLASLYGEIESAGIIQYHHLLVIYDSGEAPCLFFGAEWSKLDPCYKDEPMLGVFSGDGHGNCGGSTDWLDDALFVLGSIKLAREMLRFEDSGLVEGEARALTEILKRLQRPSNDATLVRHRSGYEEALRSNDEQMVAYMKSIASR